MYYMYVSVFGFVCIYVCVCIMDFVKYFLLLIPHAGCKVDIGVLMDESGSVKDADFGREKNFVKQLAGSFQLGPHAAQVGVITFGTNARLDIPLNRHRNLQSFYKGIDSIRQEGSLTLFASI